MNTDVTPYCWAALCAVAILGMALALHQELKPATKARVHRWSAWIVVFAVLALFDAVMLARPWA